MGEYISERDFGSIEEPSMAAYAGLTITDGGICLQRTELPQTVTVAGALSNEAISYITTSGKMLGDLGPFGEDTPAPDTDLELVYSGIAVNSEFQKTLDEQKMLQSLIEAHNNAIKAEKMQSSTETTSGKMLGDLGPFGEDTPAPDTDLELVYSGIAVNSEFQKTLDEQKMLQSLIEAHNNAIKAENVESSCELGQIHRDNNRDSAIFYYLLNTSAFIINDDTFTYGNLGFVSTISSLTWSDFHAGTDEVYYNAPYLIGANEMKVVDAEKSLFPNDLNKCWAAADANMLYQTGWIISGVKTEDQVLDIYRNNFSRGFQYGGYSYYGANWYLTGDYQPLTSTFPGYDMCSSGTGGFFSSSIQNIDDYLKENGSMGLSLDLDTIANTLYGGGLVSLSVRSYIGSNVLHAHALTLHGFIFETNETASYYTGIIVSDSDDNPMTPSTEASDVLKVIPIIPTSAGYIYLNPNFYYPNTGLVRIEKAVLLEPANYTTLGTYDSSLNANIIIKKGATLLRTTVEDSYELRVSSAGLAMDTMVTSGGVQTVLANGTALDTIVSSGGSMIISSGGTALFSSGGHAENIIASSGAILGLTVAPGTYLKGSYDLDQFEVSANSISSYTVHSGCMLDILSGGTATDITAENGAHLGITVAPNTYASGTYGGSAFEMTSSATISNYTVHSGCKLDVLTGGVASNTSVLSGGMIGFAGGTAQGVTTISSGGKMTLSGPMNIANGANVSALSGASVDFDISNLTPANTALVNNLSLIQGAPDYTITVSGTNAYGLYTLANGAPANYSGSMALYRGSFSLGTLSVGGTISRDYKKYLLKETGNTLSLNIAERRIKSDRDHNRISDVMFVWTGNNYAHGYWMNGTNEWWSANAVGVSPDWVNLGSYDMCGDGKADAVMFGNVVINNVRGAYIGYYQDGDDANGWVTIGYLNNEENIAWQNKVGNLTGNTSGANSIVWHAPELGALGVWTDGTTNWVGITGWFDENWTMLGCGDFNGDGKDSVLMSLDSSNNRNNSSLLYSVDLDGTLTSLGNADWFGWDVRAIGDFSGDGKDDIILFENSNGEVKKLINGNADNSVSLGNLNDGDKIVGCGDYDGDCKDDLLVQKSQGSTTVLCYYSEGILDSNHWNGMGTVTSGWEIIA